MSFMNSYLDPKDKEQDRSKPNEPISNIKKPENRNDNEIDASDIINKMLGITKNTEGKEEDSEREAGEIDDNGKSLESKPS